MHSKRKGSRTRGTLEGLFEALARFPQPVQIVVVIGVLLLLAWLLAWLMSHPEVLTNLISILLLWKSIKGS